MRSGLCWRRKLGAVVVLLAGGMIAIAGAQKEKAPMNKGVVDKPVSVNGVNRSPEGAKFPVCWAYKFDQPGDLSVGKDVEITISVTPILFDMKEVELVPATGGELKLVSGEAWKGSLKKGESHAVKLVIRATTNGFNGPYGVTVKAPAFYDEVAAFVTAQKEGLYADPSAKISVLQQLDGMRQEQPVCEEWFGSTIEIK